MKRAYHKSGGNGPLKILLGCAYVIGWIELICICLAFFFFYRSRSTSNAPTQGYLVVATGIKRFTYAELKKATKDFTEQIGRGGAGVVYKGVLPDQRIAAIKQLNEANQGKEEFLAEVSTIGRLNHIGSAWSFMKIV